jgi:hypothetical protein
MDFKLDSTTFDLVWRNGPLLASDTTQTNVEVTGQRLLILLRTWMNEWFLDTTYGIPWEQRIIAKKQSSKASTDLILQQKVLSDAGVKEIVSWDSTFVNRKYTLTFQVKVVDGTVSGPIVVASLN